MRAIIFGRVTRLTTDADEHARDVTTPTTYLRHASGDYAAPRDALLLSGDGDPER